MVGTRTKSGGRLLNTLAVAAGLMMGCGGTPMAQQIPIQRSRRYAQNLDTLGVESSLSAPVARIWAALPAVYADLGLEVNFREPSPKRTGTCYQQVHGRLGREALSTYLDCGDSRSVPNADRFDVALTVLTTVVAVSDQTAKVYTFVLGAGNDGASSTGRVWCYSKGALEDLIRKRLEERLAG